MKLSYHFLRRCPSQLTVFVLSNNDDVNLICLQCLINVTRRPCSDSQSRTVLRRLKNCRILEIIIKQIIDFSSFH